VQDQLKRENERVLELERELQSIKLEFEETVLLLNTARRDLELHSRQSDATKSYEVRKQFEKLFQELAGPTAQLQVQDHILNVQGKPLKPEDIMACANRLLRALQNHGFKIQGKIGETVRFDSNLHEPLALEESVQPEEEVLIRMPGVSYDGKILRRAAVTKQSQRGQGEQ
jgi:hypothetical protein